MRRFPWGALLVVFIAINLQAWVSSEVRSIRLGWTGVPPAPSRQAALALALGDDQFYYRASTFSLQNMGDFGGDVTPLKNYDYKRLGQWFTLLDSLDPESAFLPLLVGFYFSATQTTADLPVVIDYLARIAERDPERNWRWLVHAIYLARHRMKDLPKALALSYRLAAFEVPGLPAWTKQMPAFVLTRLGDKEGARIIMETILRTDRNLTPEEARFIRRFLKTRVK